MLSGEGRGYYAAQLRREIIARNAAFAKDRGLACVESYGSAPVIVYEPCAEGSLHGNFIGCSYAAILQNQDWSKRLTKVHAQGARSLPKRDRRWMELDSSTSSDALLMNIFCYPNVIESVANQLGVEPCEIPEFGFKAKVPFANGRFDRTEVDVRLGSLLVEAKLTESDFQNCERSLIDSYRDFAGVFDRRMLPHDRASYRSYQLIRNVLAAHALGFSFCVLLDQRRPDLLEDWYSVMRSVRDYELKTRCKVLTWQELSERLPEELRAFLDVKYGIVPPGTEASAIPGAEIP